MGIRDLIDRIEKVKDNIDSLDSVISDVVRGHSDVILSLNKDQMLLGRDADGKVLTPSYWDDPYFESRAKANRYAGMKYKLESKHRSRIEHPTLYPDKDKDTPNLIVTGLFQDGMFIQVDDNSHTIGSSYIESDAIESKYRGVVFGLSPESREYFYKNYLFKRLQTLLMSGIK